ncbi:FG-GAP-like repeat-containing protein [Streptomyces sp. BR1]|uniref:FG-GAP-like repeat-containing protein n=1 Tax=Streptomyces sp. BR1 TaxID=1592323 RepID=UPI00402B7A01
MRRHTLVRSAVATVTAIGIAAGIAPLTTGAAFAADAPAELVIPADRQADPNATVINAAGESGYLSGWTKSGFNWTTYADGATKPVTMPKGMTTAWATGTDTLVLTGSADAGHVVQRHMKDGSERTLPLPAGQLFAGAFGDYVVTDGQLGMSLLFWEDGKVQEKRVSGAGVIRSLYSGNKDGIFVEQKYSGMTMVSWLDKRAIADSTHLEASQYDNGKIVVSGGRAVQWTKNGKATVWKTSDYWQADQYLTLPGYDSSQLLGVVGDYVMVARPLGKESQYSDLNYRVVALPFNGGRERVVFEKATAMARSKPDGTMVIGAEVEGRRAVYAVGASLDATKIADASTQPTRVAGISLAQGRLNTVDLVPGDEGPEARLRGMDLSVNGPLTAGPRTDRGADPKDFPASGAPDLQATGDGRLVYRAADGGVRVLDEGAKLPGRKLDVQADVLRASGHFVATKSNGIRVTDLDTGKPVYTGPSGNDFALSGSTLWNMGEPATVDAVDVRTGKRLDRAVVGDCMAPALQAQGTSVYWECAPDNSGVYDTVTKKSVKLPAHESALLGEGYVAWEQDGVLSVTDVRGATGTHTVGKPADARPGRGWTVDRFGGAVAYVDAAGDTHVVPSGVDTSKSGRKVLDEDVPATMNAKSGATTFRWWLPRPATRWILILRKGSDDAGVVRDFEGMGARGPISVEWDGKDRKGRLATNGRYTWELYSDSADKKSPMVLAKSSFTLTGAAPAPRDYVGDDGLGDLLAFTPAGVADFRGGKDGRVDAKVSGSGWTGANTVTAAVPFGDVDGDGSNDVLVRLSSGELRAYKPMGKALTPSTPYARIGGGWNIYDSLTSTGDFTGDGRADLIAREASTGDLYLYEANGSGNFKSRVKIGRGWKNYTITGAGDLNGDGFTDLLARDASGVLWLYPGTGKGELAARTKVGDGWQAYNSLVGAGDLNGDGRPDLLARDTAGVLWSYAGDGKGNFAGRVRIGGGWQMYKYIA